MTPRFLIKLATKEPEVYTPPRIVPPLAQVKAQQLNVPLQWLLNGSMGNVMNFLTNNLKSGKITTKQASQTADTVMGATNEFARQHTLSPQTDNKAKLWKIMHTPYYLGIGYPGACDTNAYINSILDPNVIEGLGENVLSMNKFQNIFNIKNIGSMGRSGGTRLA